MSRKIKKVISMVISVVLLISAIPFSGFVGLDFIDFKASAAAEIETDTTISGTIGAKLSWSIDKTSKVLSIDNDGVMVSFASDDAPWKNYKNYFESVVVNEGCTSISQHAFYYCDNIVSVDLPTSIESIGDSAFCHCSLLKQISIPQNVTKLGLAVFYGCSSLLSVDFLGDEKITSIPSEAFAYCSNISKIDIPTSVTSIGSYAFSKCTNLSEINSLKNITYIEQNAFEYCEKIKTIELNECTICYYAFCNSGVVSLDINNCTLTSKYNWSDYFNTFQNCSSLKNIKINNTNIPNGAFANCNNIETIEIKGDCKIHSDAFFNIDKLTTVSFDCTNLSIDACAFYDCDALTSILVNCSISDDYNFIGASAFYGCDNLESAIISVGIDSIFSEAFKNCPKLEKVTIFNKDCSIDETAISIYSTIYGYIGSTAETFAKTYGYNFVSIDVPCEHTYSNACDASCNICGEIRETGAHDYSEWTVIKETSCSKTGLKERTCSICGNTDKQIIEMSDHTDEDENGICDICKKQFEIKYLMNGVCGDNLTWTLDDNGVLTISGTGGMYDFNENNYIKISTSEDTTTTWWYKGEETTTRRYDNDDPIDDRETTEAATTKKDETTSRTTTSPNYPTTKKNTESQHFHTYPYWYYETTNSAKKYTIRQEETTTKPTTIREESTTAPHETRNAASPAHAAKAVDYIVTTTCTNAYSPEEGYIKILRWNLHFDKIKKVVIESGVTSIGDYAFAECTQLQEIDMADSVCSIGYRAFSNCSGLKEIEIPKDANYIKSHAFANCSLLETIRFNAMNCSFGYDVFDNSPIKTLYVGAKVNTLPNLRSIKKAVFADGVTKVPDNAFSGYSELTEVYLPGTITQIGNYAFNECTALESITIPDSVTNIGNHAFYRCSSLASVTIPECVTRIGYSAFANCSLLETIRFNAMNCSFGYDVFDNSPIKTLYVGAKVNTLPNLRSIKKAVFADGVTKVPDNAFSHCDNLITVVLPDSVKSVGVCSFEYCTSLETITLPKNLEKIERSAFFACANLKTADLPKNITSIGSCAFDTCLSLSEVIIPDSIKYIGDFAFHSCVSITDLTIPEGVLKMGVYSFGCCYSLKSVVFNATACDVYSADIFYGCADISSVIFGNRVTVIPIMLMKDKKLLSSIEIPSSVREIGESAFNGTALETIDLPEGIKTIGNNAFSNIETAKAITIPTTTEEIKHRAFANLTALETVNYNATDCTISYNNRIGAFNLCKNVKTVNIGENVIVLPPYAFTGCDNLEKAYIPDVVIRIDPLAFDGCGNVVIACKNGSYANVFAVQTGMKYLLEDNVNGTAFEIKNSMLLGYSGSAQNIVLPSDLSSVGIDALNGNDIVKSIEIPYNISKIYSGAFANCQNLEQVIIPFTVTDISSSAFEETNATIYCYYNSYAYNYAVANGIKCELIGVTLSTNNLNINEGESVAVKASATVTLASGLPIVWKSNDDSIASVDSYGKITGKKAGDTIVGAYGIDGSLLNECAVKVNGKIGISLRIPSTTTISYGDSIVLHANIENQPAGARVVWEASNGNFSYSVSPDGSTCTISPKSSGDTEFTAKIVDSNGKVLSSGTQKMTSKAGFWQKLVAFFKSLFGSNQVIPYTVKNLFR